MNKYHARKILHEYAEQYYELPDDWLGERENLSQMLDNAVAGIVYMIPPNFAPATIYVLAERKGIRVHALRKKDRVYFFVEEKE